MESKTESKTESIKLRVTKTEKNRLIALAKVKKESLSSYMLKKSLEDSLESYDTMPDKIEICNLMNEIYHEVEKNGNQKLRKNIRQIYQNYRKNQEAEV